MNADLQEFRFKRCTIYQPEKMIVFELEIFDDDITNGPSYKNHKITFSGVLTYLLNAHMESAPYELNEIHMNKMTGNESNILDGLAHPSKARIFRIEYNDGLADHIVCNNCVIDQECT